MWQILYEAINYFDVVPPLLLLIFASAKMRWQTRDYVVYYLVIQFLFNGYATILDLLEKTNLFAYSLNFSWSFFILGFYFANLYASPFLTRLIFGFIAVYQLQSIAMLRSLEAVATFNSVSFGLISLLITIGSLFYYTRQLSGQPKENILKVSDFWYVNGIFTYYTSNFFIFLTYNTLTNRNDANIGVIWKIHNVVFLIMCVYFYIGMRCKVLPEK